MKDSVIVKVLFVGIVYVKLRISYCDDESLRESEFIVRSNVNDPDPPQRIASFASRKDLDESAESLSRNYNYPTKKRPDNRYATYTAFPPVTIKNNAPESLYFPKGDRYEVHKASNNNNAPLHGFLRIKRSDNYRVAQRQTEAESKHTVRTAEVGIDNKEVNSRNLGEQPENGHPDENQNSPYDTETRSSRDRNENDDLPERQDKNSPPYSLKSNINLQVGNGSNLSPSRRLTSGRDATISDYPYVVSIQKNNEHWCSGALVTPRIVVTTANCVWKSKQTSKMKVRVGSRHSNTGGYLVGIQEVRKHPDWSVRKDPDCDVALLVLNTTIKFSDDLHAAELPNEHLMPPFDDAWVTSWGTERPDGLYKPPDIPLHVYHARLIERSKCNNITKRYGVQVTENFICLAQTGSRAPCTRDTGAPAVSDGVVWGLASWGIRKTCGTERYPAVFSYLASKQNMEFIANATSDIMMEIRKNPFSIE